MTRVVAYVSGHGFGHATRTAEVLKAFRAAAPEAPIAVVSAAPEALFRAAVPGRFEYRPLDCDVGVAQKDALVIDVRATLARWRAFTASFDDRVQQEADWLVAVGARVVLGDIPPLAFAAAGKAKVPSVGLANFSWDWIYRHLARREPGLGEAADHSAAAYGGADLLLRLPFAGDLSAFPRVLDIPLVARRPKVARAVARRRLGLDDRPAVLLSFGGIGLPGFRPRVLAPTVELQFLVPDRSPDLPANVQSVDADRMRALHLGYEDVVGAVDVVVTKPGYGIVTDAIGAGARLVYTDRGDFPEYPILVEGMKRYLATAYVSNEALREGRVGDSVRDVLAMPQPAPPDMSGAQAAAGHLLDRAGGRRT
jgi:L-arabinokinase